MTLEETRNILHTIKVAYPHSFNKMDRQEMTEMLQLWSAMLKDYDPLVVAQATKEIIQVNKFAPSLSELMNKCGDPNIAMIGDGHSRRKVYGNKTWADLYHDLDLIRERLNG